MCEDYVYLGVCLVSLLVLRPCQLLQSLKTLLLLQTAGYAQPGGPHAQQQVGQAGALLLLDVSDVPHDDVDQGVLHQGQEHEHRAARHEHVYSLQQRGDQVGGGGADIIIQVLIIDFLFNKNSLIFML